MCGLSGLIHAHVRQKFPAGFSKVGGWVNMAKSGLRNAGGWSFHFWLSLAHGSPHMRAVLPVAENS